jgi:ribosome maturation factor RimP
MAKLTELVASRAAPLAEAAGCEIWDVEYVREAGTWYLRVYLDCEGGVTINQCEAVSRALSDWLDEADPIADAYTLEVSSAGAERVLRRPGDFARYLGSPVVVRLYRAQDGKKEYVGPLRAFEDGAVTIETGGAELKFEKNEVAQVRLHVEW